MTLQILQAFFFVVDNRKGKVYRGWKSIDIFEEIRVAAQAGTMFLVKNKAGAITALVIGKLADGNMHVSAVLSTKPGKLQQFYKAFRAKWPTVKKLTAERRGKRVEYNLEQLDRRLT